MAGAPPLHLRGAGRRKGAKPKPLLRGGDLRRMAGERAGVDHRAAVKQETCTPEPSTSTRQRPTADVALINANLVLQSELAHARRAQYLAERYRDRTLWERAAPERAALKLADKKTLTAENCAGHLRRRLAAQKVELDAIKESRKEDELKATHAQRQMEAAELLTLIANTERDVAGEKQAQMKQALSRRSSELTAATEHVDKFRSRIASLSGKLSATAPHRQGRSLSDVAQMPGGSKLALETKGRADRRAKVSLLSSLGEKPSPESIAAALAKAGLLHSVLAAKGPGQDALWDQAVAMRQSLQAVWDAELSVEMKVDLGLTDWQMNEMRFKLCYQWSEGRWVKRRWFTHPHTKQVLYFPEPIVSKHKWGPLFVDLCETHRIELVGEGRVAQRGFSDALALLLTRTDKLLPAAEDVTAATPIAVSVGWDALRHAGRHVVHGGVKVASFRAGVESTQSELNFVSTNVWRDNDDHKGLVRGLSQWVPALNKIKKQRTFERGSTPWEAAAGAVQIGGGLAGKRTAVPALDPRNDLPRSMYHLDLTATLDLSAARSIAARTKGCASHCECDNGDSDDRVDALHHWPCHSPTDTWDTMLPKLEKCRLLLAQRSTRLSHTPPTGHDWAKEPELDCDECDWTADEKQYGEEAARIEMLAEQAPRCADTKKLLDKLRKTHRLTHLKAELMHVYLLSEFDAISFIVDMMHGMPINIAHILFKYSFLDVLTTPESREDLAIMLTEIDCPFDCRLDSQHGWMRASAMQAFECGSAKSPGLGPNILRCCDMAFGRDRSHPRHRRPPPPHPHLPL